MRVRSFLTLVALLSKMPEAVRSLPPQKLGNSELPRERQLASGTLLIDSHTDAAIIRHTRGHTQIHATFSGAAESRPLSPAGARSRRVVAFLNRSGNISGRS